MPHVVEIAQEYIEKERLTRKITTLAGNYLTDDIGSGYDLAFVSAIVHINSLEENFDLFEKIYDSLNRGAKVVVQDFVVNIERTEPQKSSTFALNMFFEYRKRQCLHSNRNYNDAQKRNVLRRKGASHAIWNDNIYR